MSPRPAINLCDIYILDHCLPFPTGPPNSLSPLTTPTTINLYLSICIKDIVVRETDCGSESEFMSQPDFAFVKITFYYGQLFSSKAQYSSTSTIIVIQVPTTHYYYLRI